MRRLLGWLLILHGLAHAAPGMWVTGVMPLWLVTVLWTSTTVGLLGAGFGLLRVAPFSRYARPLAFLGVTGSFVLLLPLRHPLVAPGLLMDLAGLVALARWPGWPARETPVRPSLHPVLAKLGAGLATLFVAYSAGVILFRPRYLTWGSSPQERIAPLPGDSLVPDARYRVDHVITIQAPVTKVWPWLAQIGQDRGGFYSLSSLENLIGADIHNADRIVPEWQERRAGDLVPAVPPDWFGGRLGRDIGWRVTEVVPGRALVLQGWGAFVLDSVSATTTRMHIRTRGEGRPIVGGFLMGPFGLLVFEPAHFIMQRAMLRGIRARAEGAS